MNQETQKIKIRFDAISPAEARQRAQQLRDEILDLGPGITAVIEKDDSDTMDFGATLVLVLGTPAVIVLAKGLKDYLERRGGSVTIEADGKVVAKGIRGGDVARIAEAISKKDR